MRHPLQGLAAVLRRLTAVLMYGGLCAAGAWAAPGDVVTVVYVNGIATTASQAVGDRNALAAALQGAALRPDYPETIPVENAHNPTEGFEADSLELVALKRREELYLARLWRGLREGNDAPALLDAADVADVVATQLPNEPPQIQAVVQSLVTRWTPLLADPQRKLVLVGHSQGNFIVNWVWLSLLRDLGPVALQRVRVVNVATSTAWSPFGLDVTLAEDRGLYTWGAGKGLTAPRDTPFCRSATLAQGCPFRILPATVDAGGLCTTESPEGGTFSCHNFRSTYLSALPTATLAGRRLAAAAFVREGETLAQRLVDAVYTAIDAMNGAVPAGWLGDVEPDFFTHRAGSTASGSISLGASAAPRAAAVARATYDQGVQATWRGCIDAAPSGDSQIVFDLQRRDSLLSSTPDAASVPLWAVGVATRAANPNTLFAVFGRAPTPGPGVQIASTRPARTAGAFCGQFQLAVDADGHGRVRFVNDRGGAVWAVRSSQPVTDGVKRLHLSTQGASPLSVQGLEVADVAFEPPFEEDPP